MTSISTYTLFCVCTQSEIDQTSNINIHHITANILEISTYMLFCAFTQNEIGQTSNVNIHHIHCKYPGNIYLHSILCMYTKRDRSNKQHQHPSYSLQG